MIMGKATNYIFLNVVHVFDRNLHPYVLIVKTKDVVFLILSIFSFYCLLSEKENSTLILYDLKFEIIKFGLNLHCKNQE